MSEAAPPPPLGAHPTLEGTGFGVWSGAAERIWVCLFDDAGAETARVPLERGEGGIHSAFVAGVAAGQRYGLRAEGPDAPEAGHRFDPAKLLVDPYAHTLDRPFAFDARLAAPRADGIDTATLVPKAVVAALPPPLPLLPPLFRPGGLIYELAVKAFTIRHPEVPEALRGTVAALAHPAVIAHLHRLCVDAVELMPVTAWIDERHLAETGLGNAWGYNPVAFMALDPRLCPGGIAELRDTVGALRAAGIGVILDVVFNHTGEGDAAGPTLSLRGFDNRAYFRHDAGGRLTNESGCGNTLDCDHPAMRRLILDSLRHFVAQAGVGGFRFDLAPVLGRTSEGFDPHAPTLQAIATDPQLADRVLIAEPWDIGPGGYRLGAFPPPFLEWNDRFRDGVRRFWRGEPHALGAFATALSGSSDVFAAPQSRSVNYIAAHDGFALADVVSYAHKHNHSNGEGNRDGHHDNLSWNHGVEGATDDPTVREARARDLQALLAALFASRGTIMLTAGDEFGRTQSGNNNAYAQDNATTWLDWENRDRELDAASARFAALRRAHSGLSDPGLRTGAHGPEGAPDLDWRLPSGAHPTPRDWEEADAGPIAMLVGDPAHDRMAVLFNPTDSPIDFALPARPGHAWEGATEGMLEIGPRAVRFARERPAAAARAPGDAP